MSRFISHIRLGTRWLGAGWRLFMRNPWLLGGMGACCSLLFVLLWAIPLLGGPLIALAAPPALGSFYLAIDRVSKLNMSLPPVLRAAAVRQSPRELLRVWRGSKHLVAMVVVCLYDVLAVLLINMLLWLIAGSAWNRPLSELSMSGILAVTAAMGTALILYFLLASSLIYALPRTLLRDKPLIPQMARGFRASLHYAAAVATVLVVLGSPICLAGLVSTAAPWSAYLLAFAAYAVILPWIACSLYCSYRFVFQPRPPVAAHA